jgi:2-polyprenyl-3-methyl-5-hydroxy-6-metoxy-1,4-benzoquinol methylase
MSGSVCIVCEREAAEEAVEHGKVRSNVRAFRNERFEYWRCPHCRTLHAKDEVDLAKYYASYPFHSVPEDWRVRATYRNLLGRLHAAGLEPGHRILDYGCGGGRFVRYVASQGYPNVRGFDEFSDEYGDRSVLDDQYDCIVSQDVIEHVPSPNVLLAEFRRLARPSAIVAIGTPDAAAIDLARPEKYVHSLHAPYHRHMLSKDALVAGGERQGLKLARFYPRMYADTRVPFLNDAFYRFYMAAADDTLDALMEPVRVGGLLLRAPVTLFLGLFGSLFSRGTDVMAVFHRAA